MLISGAIKSENDYIFLLECCVLGNLVPVSAQWNGQKPRRAQQRVNVTTCSIDFFIPVAYWDGTCSERLSLLLIELSSMRSVCTRFGSALELVSVDCTWTSMRLLDGDLVVAMLV